MSAETFDVVVLGGGIGGLSAALAAFEHGLRPVLLEKSDQLGGTTSDSYGLIWVGNNHLMQAAGEAEEKGFRCFSSCATTLGMWRIISVTTTIVKRPVV